MDQADTRAYIRPSYFCDCIGSFRRGVARVTRKWADRYYRVAIYAPGIVPVGPPSLGRPAERASRGRNRAERISARKTAPAGSLGDYPRVTDRTARGQSKQVVSLHFTRNGEELQRKERDTERRRETGRRPSCAISAIKPGVMVI